MRNRRSSFAVCFIIGLCVWAVFGQTIHHDFINFDDDKYVYENAVIKRGLSLNGLVWAFTHLHLHNWHPVTTLSNMLDCQLYGLNAGGHHLTNVILHASVAMLLFGVLKQMTAAFWRSAAVALVFAIHPLRVESVAWVAERKDLLSGLFFMLTLWAYTRYVRKKSAGTGGFDFLKSSAWWQALSFFILGLMSKPMVVTLPIVLLLLDCWPLGRFALGDSRAKMGRLLLEKVPFLLLSVVSGLATIVAQKHAIQSIEAVSGFARIGNALVSYAVYLWQMVYPVDLLPLYPHPGNLLPWWQVGLSALVLLLISHLVFRVRKTCPYALVGWLWYLVMLVPVIGLLQVGAISHADRYTYLPQIGLYIMIAWGMVDVSRDWRQRNIALTVVTVAISACLLVLARIQTSYWKNSQTLWHKTIATAPRNSIALNNLGTALQNAGKVNEEVPYYERALRISPDYKDAHTNLGAALYIQGKHDEALVHFRRALQIEPISAKDHLNLGAALYAKRELNESIQHYEQALEIDPNYADTHNNLALALFMQGKQKEARQHFEQALKLAIDQNQHALADTIRSRIQLLPPDSSP